VQLTRTYSREQVLRAACIAADNRLFRYRDLKRLAAAKAMPESPPLIAEHPSIRPMTDYRMEDFA